jgi:hypothetical protein
MRVCWDRLEGASRWRIGVTRAMLVLANVFSSVRAGTMGNIVGKTPEPIHRVLATRAG